MRFSTSSVFCCLATSIRLVYLSLFCLLKKKNVAYRFSVRVLSLGFGTLSMTSCIK